MPSATAKIDLQGFIPSSAQELRVTHVSTTDVRGGAARAAHRLHRALRGVGVQSRMLVAQRFGPGAPEEVVAYNPFAPAPAVLGRAFFRLARRWHRPPIRQAGAFFSPDWSFTGWRLPSQMPQSDVVNLHWVADLLDYRTLPALTARVPVVWTFHDMNAFTGGCHYSGNCVRYRATCGACPQLATSKSEYDMTRRVLLRKQQVLGQVAPDRLKIICPSHWLAGEARLSTLFRRFEVRVIPNGIDVEEFHPVDRAEARTQLELPPRAKIILFVADQIDDERKGLGVLLKALEPLAEEPDLMLVTLGRGGDALPTKIFARHLGELSESANLRAAYSAADVFVIPTRQDNLPNTVLESMACGTPVVGFRAGGVGEAVMDGTTGVLVPTGDVAALTDALRRLITNRAQCQQLARQCRPRIEQHYTSELQARRYASLYEEIHGQPNEGDARQVAPADL